MCGATSTIRRTHLTRLAAAYSIAETSKVTPETVVSPNAEEDAAVFQFPHPNQRQYALPLQTISHSLGKRQKEN